MRPNTPVVWPYKDAPFSGPDVKALMLENKRLRDALEYIRSQTNGTCQLCAPLSKWGHTAVCPLNKALQSESTTPEKKP